MEMETDTKVFGFWVYLMTDLLIFAVLFATFAVLRTSTFGGPSGHQLFEMPFALVETLLLLVSSFTCSLGMLAVHREQKKPAIFCFALTFALGAAFLVLELSEFSKFAHQGDSWQRSGFLSSYFTLVGTHGLHISVGLLWMLVAMFQIALRPLVEHTVSRIWRMALFWHFLDFVWIFIFTVVYGMEHLL
jgi:cytochrome o ubiquinol oxidase subunit III